MTNIPTALNNEQPSFNIVVLEDEASQFREFEGYYKELFSFVGGNIQVLHCAEKRELAKFLSPRPPVVICDIMLGSAKGSEFEGLEAIAEYRERYPDVIFLAATREELRATQLGIKFPNPDVVISKIYLKTNTNYREYLTALLREKLTRNVITDFYITGDRNVAFKGFRSSAPPRDDEIRSMLSQITFVGHGLDEVTSIRRASLTPLPGGLSGSAVFEIRVFANQKEPLGVPGVIKISSRENARLELENYNRYVKWLLRYTWRVDILGAGFVKNFGAVCYSFVHGGARRTHSLNEFIQKGDPRATDRVLGSILSPDAQTWYSLRRQGIKDDISLYYSGAPFFWTSKQVDDTEEKFIGLLKQFASKSHVRFDKEKDTLTIENYRCRTPAYLLFSEKWGDYTECICHGDLRAENILCDGEMESLAFIDFQRTGYAHVFRDFISFESSVRLEFPDPVRDRKADLLHFIDIELKTLRNGWDTSEGLGNGYLQEVAKIRATAFSNFKQEAFSKYVFGLAVHHLRLIQRLEWTELQSLRLLGVVVAALIWLGENRDMA